LEVIEIDAPLWRGAVNTGLVGAALAAATAACGSSTKSSRDSDRQLLKIALTDKGCSPKRLSAKSGPLTFVVTTTVPTR
jgi:hypothetical protein